MAGQVALAHCPTCKGPVRTDAVHRPFCSDRCRLLDLGKWCDEEYAVAAPEREEE